MLKFTADNTDRLDKFIASQAQVSRSQVQRVIKNGLVTINDKVQKETDWKVKIGDVVELPEFESDDLKPFDLELKVVFENDDVVVIDKPAGLVVHPGAGNKDQTLANALIHKFPEIVKVGDPHRPGIVHRLDEDTSGLILIAKNENSFEYFKNLFQTRNIEKEYLALVHGVPEKLHGIIDAPLEKVPLKQKMKVGSGKEAVTEYSVVDSDPSLQFSLIRVKLHTGRTHQIRAHMNHIGHPIFADQVYGAANYPKDSQILDRQFLHAYKLKFQLPDKTWIDLQSKLPTDLISTLKQINIPYDDSKF